MEILIIWIIGCLLVGYMASGTTLGFASGFLLSLILSPIIGFIIALLYPSKKKELIVKDISSIQDRLQKLEEMKSQLSEKEYNFLRKQIIK